MAFFTGTLLASSMVVGSSGDTYGSHYSVLGVGGYLEVDTITDRNNIPVSVDKGLDFDGLSSGRRRLGMRVFVAEEGKTYRLEVPYSTWSGLTETAKVTALSNNSNWVEKDFNLIIPSGQTYIVTDQNASPQGIQLAADYSSTAGPLSLMPKSYIDSIAAGLDPKESVNVATIANIDLTGGTFSSGSTIDGVVVNDGWRVLVKDQTDGTQNGIYVYSASTSGFTRSSDFDGSPSGEVTTGAYVNVVTGSTLYNTQWMVVTPDPITVGSTVITWTLISQAKDHIGGVGITISANTITFDGASIAGSGLGWTGNTLWVDPNSGYIGAELTSLESYIDTVSGNTDTNATAIANLQADTITGATNVGSGAGVYSGTSNNVLQLRSISGGTSIVTTVSGDTILINAQTGGERIESDITQASHGFSIGDVVAYSGGSWYLPTSIVDGGEPLGMVSESADTNTFTIVYRGYIDTLSGVVDENTDTLSADTVYYLSSTTPGKLTPTEPSNTDDIVKPMIIMETTSTGVVVNYRGDIVSAPPDVYSAQNIGNGDGEVFSGTTGTSFVFRTLASGNSINITNNADTVQIDAFTNVNAGSGTGLIYSGQTGTSEVFRSIVGGNAMTVSTSGNEITLDVDTGSTKIVDIFEFSGSSVTATTSNEFVGISGLTGVTTGCTVYLPAVPIIGKPMIITDMKGNAQTNVIRVEGNGNLIDGDTFADINTDYGAIQVLYTGAIWKVISFA